MSSGFEFKLHGLDGLEEKLTRLGNIKATTSAARRALRAGAKVIAQQAEVGARGVDDPETGERISNNIAIRAGGKRREARVRGAMVRIGVLGGALSDKRSKEIAAKRAKSKSSKRSSPNPGGDTRHWRFIEFGTSKTAARPFMREAMARRATQAIDVTTEYFDKWLSREMRKMDKAGKP